MDQEESNNTDIKGKKELKTIVKHIRYSEKEWHVVEEKLKSSKLSYSQFIRKVSFRARVTPINMEVIKLLRDTRNELSIIGNNINAIARACQGAAKNNNEIYISNLQKCRDTAIELSAELDKLRNTIK